jgi:hypothetical protein
VVLQPNVGSSSTRPKAAAATVIAAGTAAVETTTMDAAREAAMNAAGEWDPSCVIVVPLGPKALPLAGYVP